MNALINLIEQVKILSLKRRIEYARTERDALESEKQIYKIYIRAVRRSKKLV